MLRYLLLFLFLLPVLLRAQTMTDPQQAFQQAAASHKPVLLVFQGSDWCIPCIKLERKVLSSPGFLAFVQDKLIVLKADFPQKKKIAAALEKQYESLAAQYNAEGSFPKMVLLDASGKMVQTFRTDYTQPSELTGDLEKALKNFHAEM